MPRRWTEDERREHAALMQRLHQQRRFPHYTLPPELRAAIAAELRQLANPKATHIARRYDVAHSTVCAIARAEGIRLKPGRDPRRAERCGAAIRMRGARQSG
jgi:hypothetical protein